MTPAPMNIDRPGFADPVQHGQATFRAVLDAMARPGTIHTLHAPAAPPPPLGRAAAAVLLTLVDHDTPLWLDPACAPATDWVRFHCAAPLVPLAEAAFALAPAGADFAALGPGTDEGPEDGATLILQLETLGDGPAYTLDGPGLAAPTAFHASLPAGFEQAWARNRARFPRGFDLILCAGNRLAAFPRTLAITRTIRVA